MRWFFHAVLALICTVGAATWLNGKPPADPPASPPNLQLAPPLLDAPLTPALPSPTVPDLAVPNTSVPTPLVPRPPLPAPLPRPSLPRPLPDGVLLEPTQVPDRPTPNWLVDDAPAEEPEESAEESEAIESTVKEILKLRDMIGSPLKGTVLESDGQGGNHFEQFLRRAVEAAPPEPSQARAAESNDLAEPRAIPPSSVESPSDVIQALRHAAGALSQHAQALEVELPARAERMRSLAKRLRQESREMEELGL